MKNTDYRQFQIARIFYRLINPRIEALEIHIAAEDRFGYDVSDYGWDDEYERLYQEGYETIARHLGIDPEDVEDAVHVYRDYSLHLERSHYFTPAHPDVNDFFDPPTPLSGDGYTRTPKHWLDVLSVMIKGRQWFDRNVTVSYDLVCQWLFDAAYQWPTCACGEKCKNLPRTEGGMPKDWKLGDLGIDFFRDVNNWNWKAALLTFIRIEVRTAKLLRLQAQLD